MVYVFLADGFEEIEALTPIDLLRRAGIKVTTVGIGSTTPTGAHGVTVMADLSEDVFFPDNNVEAIVLPGGAAGTANLERSGTVQRAVRLASEEDITVAAICAAPVILAGSGLLRGKKAAVYPTHARELGESYSKDALVYDEPFLTAKSAGYAIDFSLKLIEVIADKATADKVAAAIHYDRKEKVK